MSIDRIPSGGYFSPEHFLGAVVGAMQDLSERLHQHRVETLETNARAIEDAKRAIHRRSTSGSRPKQLYSMVNATKVRLAASFSDDPPAAQTDRRVQGAAENRFR